ncbi:ABC transporter C family member 4-like [Dorcoceras hygrometricum]|uniref:ABC transporter C family member 4-like n=1 Tax=Dorcoceras hygrometricum TaxID=472368 RepID=A0A2Z7ATD2_9LAMI|nr:ABC transporter C family member 4-like [Dorcoceras hygrometricum]
MCHWVTRKWHKNHTRSLSDVAAAFSSSRCEVIRHVELQERTDGAQSLPLVVRQQKVEEIPSTDSHDVFEQRMEIIIQRSWARTELEIEHPSDGKKKRCFITAYQRGWFLQMATPGTKIFTDMNASLLELQKAYPYIFRGDVAMMDTAFAQIAAGSSKVVLSV